MTKENKIAVKNEDKLPTVKKNEKNKNGKIEAKKNSMKFFSADPKVILIVLDGLNLSTAKHTLGYLHGLCERYSKLNDKEAVPASFHSTISELPSLSRPLYETLLTGKTPIESGIVHNQISRLSKEESLFHLVKNQGFTTGAAAYHWISELYNRTPYDPLKDRHTEDITLPINYGSFYHADNYPDDHLFFDANAIIERHKPNFMLVHPMNVDDAGHHFGADSPQYRNAARKVDGYLSLVMPSWLEKEYQIIITADHGMNNDFSHGGRLKDEREVPLFFIGQAFNHQFEGNIAQTEIAGIIATLMGLSHKKKNLPAIFKK